MFELLDIKYRLGSNKFNNEFVLPRLNFANSFGNVLRATVWQIYGSKGILSYGKSKTTPVLTISIN